MPFGDTRMASHSEVTVTAPFLTRDWLLVLASISKTCFCFSDSLWQQAGAANEGPGKISEELGGLWVGHVLSENHYPRCYIICFFCLFVLSQRIPF